MHMTSLTCCGISPHLLSASIFFAKQYYRFVLICFSHINVTRVELQQSAGEVSELLSNKYLP